MPIKIHSIMLPRPLSRDEEHHFNGEDRPVIPAGSEIAVSHYHGALKWHPQHVGLLFPRDLTSGWRITRRQFLNLLEAEGIAPVHAGVLDGLLARPELISPELKRRRTCFGGTVYSVDNFDYLRCLAWQETGRPGWRAESVLLDLRLEEGEPFLIDRFRSHDVELVL